MGVDDPSVRADDDLVHKGNFPRRKSPGNDYQKYVIFLCNLSCMFMNDKNNMSLEI